MAKRRGAYGEYRVGKTSGTGMYGNERSATIRSAAVRAANAALGSARSQARTIGNAGLSIAERRARMGQIRSQRALATGAISRGNRLSRRNYDRDRYATIKRQNNGTTRGVSGAPR